MIRWQLIVAIIKKELKDYFDNPSAYIALIVFVLLWQFFFFRGVFLVGEASLRILYDYLPWLLIFFAPSVTMSAFSSEQDEGTLELVLTHPVKQTEVLVGKFCSSFLFVAIALSFVFPIALSINLFGALDFGQIIAQYLSSLFLAASLISLGLYISSLLTSQVAVLLTSAAISFFLIVAGTEFITVNLPLFLVPIFENLSLLSHVTSMSRGVIDLRDVWYFVSFIIIFLSLSYLQLLKFKYGNRRDYYRSYQVAISLFIGIAVLTNIISSRIPGRIDLTRGSIYSLSSQTKKTIGQLTDIVNITFYASSRLLSQLTPIVREVKDVLRDYAISSKGNIQIVSKDPSGDSKVAQEAVSMGVKEVQFNVVGQEEFQLKTGFIGLVISYGGNYEVIPFIENTSDLEYQLTSLISKLTIKEKKTITFLKGDGEKDINSDYQLFNKELSKQFETKSIMIDENSSSISASSSAVLVVAGPTQEVKENTKKAIKSFIDEGGSVLFLLDAYLVNPQILNVTVNKGNLADLIKEYGVNLNEEMVYDLRANETIRLGSQGGFGFYLPYPFWLRAQADEASPITSKIESIVIPWSGSLTLDEEKVKQGGFQTVKLLKTSKYAGVKTGNIIISPDKADFSKENLKEYLLAVFLSLPKNSQEKPSGKMVVVADSDFLTDQFVSSSPENLAFGISAISLLSSAESLADIRIKQTAVKKLLFHSYLEPTLIKYTNMALAFILPAAFGLFRFYKRRSLRNQLYKFKQDE